MRDKDTLIENNQRCLFTVVCNKQKDLDCIKRIILQEVKVGTVLTDLQEVNSPFYHKEII